MEKIITSLADSMLASGSITDVHILLGVFIITIIALRKPSAAHDEAINDDIRDDIEELNRCVKELSTRIDVSAKDIEMIYERIMEIKAKIDSIDSRI